MKKFKSVDDLYNTVLPALKSRLQDLHNQKYVMLTCDDIWNYLVDNKWVDSTNLELSTLIDDILNVDGYVVSEYLRDNLSPLNREKYFENWGSLRDEEYKY